MEAIKKRLTGLITRECISKGIELENINVGCDHAEHLLNQGETAAYAVKQGMAVAEGQQRLTNSRRRSTLQYVA